MLGVEAVLPNGELVHIGGAVLDTPGLDLLGVIVGSEGTLAIVTKATVRLLRRPEAVLDASCGVRIDRRRGRSGVGHHRLRHRAGGCRDDGSADDRRGRGRRASALSRIPNAVLIVELDGRAIGSGRAVRRPSKRSAGNAGAITIEIADDPAERDRIWKGRKAAFAAMGRVSPNYYVQDGVVPRTKLPEVLRRIRELEARSGLRIGNVFHAGDGNLHPLICYDEAIPGQAEHAEKVAAEILHVLHRGRRRDHGRARRRRRQEGVYAEDVRRERSRRDAARALRVRSDRHLQPGKVFPTPRLCGEVPGPYRQHPVERAGLAERF